MPLNIPAVVKNRFPVLEDIIWDSETSYVIKSDAISNYQDLLDVRKSSIYGYMPGIVNTIPENVYSSKAFLFNPLISNSSEYVSIVFDTNANSKKDHAFRAY